MSDNATAKPTLPRRRNGNIAACEPCRKSKAKCDRTHPICSRCRKRRTPADCVYLDAPMTQMKSSSRPVPTPLSPPPTQLSSPAFRVGICLLEPADVPLPISDTHGFLGSTSFSATIRHGHLVEEDFEGLKLKDSFGEGYQNHSIDSKYFQLGLKVLQQLPSEKACHILLDYYYSSKSAEVGFQSKRGMKHCLSALWSTFGENLRSPKCDLKCVAHVIFCNSSQPVKLDDEAGVWLEPFSGINTRWETLGTLFVTFAYALLSVSDKDVVAYFGRKAEVQATSNRRNERLRGGVHRTISQHIEHDGVPRSLQEHASGDSHPRRR